MDADLVEQREYTADDRGAWRGPRLVGPGSQRGVDDASELRGRVFAQRVACQGVPPIGAWQLDDPVAEPVETELVAHLVVRGRHGLDLDLVRMRELGDVERAR